MAKKKKKQTPKDDLIESLMNDVQEISDESTQHLNAGGDLFLDDEGAHVSGDGDIMFGFGGDENRADETSEAAATLWQKMQESTGPHGMNLSKKSESDLNEPSMPSVLTPPVASSSSQETELPSLDDKTMNIQEGEKLFAPADPVAAAGDRFEKSSQTQDAEKTVAVAGFANRQPKASADVSPKISFGSLRDPRPAGSGSVYASNDATLVQAESLKLAQQRILNLEKELEKYRQENEELASAGEIVRLRAEELTSRIFALEKEKQEVAENLQNELIIVRGSLQYKETEMGKARLKIDELESRLKSDFKKIRVRERELENRLELVKAEKTALLRAKDENILELKRKIDHLQSELDNYRSKVLDLNKTLDLNQEQFKRTVRALRLALSNLEVKEENIVPLKKAD